MNEEQKTDYFRVKKIQKYTEEKRMDRMHLKKETIRKLQVEENRKLKELQDEMEALVQKATRRHNEPRVPSDPVDHHDGTQSRTNVPWRPPIWTDKYDDRNRSRSPPRVSPSSSISSSNRPMSPIQRLNKTREKVKYAKYKLGNLKYKAEMVGKGSLDKNLAEKEAYSKERREKLRHLAKEAWQKRGRRGRSDSLTSLERDLLGE
ncbi:hypothetical protein MMC19_005296 [Ptychographa xylographoides]|nr:hypothetical protein [Ptychographa xylographoides]